MPKIDGTSLKIQLNLEINFNERKVKGIFFDIFQALKYLHSNSIIHGDVKPENILWHKSQWILADFGISTLTSQITATKRRGRTPPYSAPEVELGKIISISDFWSLGVTLFQVFTHSNNISKWEESLNFSTLENDWKSLFNGLFTTNITKRWGIIEIQEWFDKKELKEEPEIQKIQQSASSLAIQLAKKWFYFTAMIEEGTFDTWLRKELKALSISFTIIDKTKENDSDIYLLNLIYTLDKNIPLLYKELQVSHENLLLIAQKAFSGDILQQNYLQELYDKKIISKLYSLTRNIEMEGILNTWIKDIDGYKKASTLVHKKASNYAYFTDYFTRFLNPAVDFANLYINKNQRNTYPLPWTDKENFCNMWVGLLISMANNNNGYGLVASLFIKKYNSDLKEDFYQYLSPNPRIVPSSNFSKEWGRNAPIAAMQAIVTPIYYRVCATELPTIIAKRIRLSWSVENSSLIYISEIGFVNNTGTYDITLGTSKSYILHTVSLGGYSNCQLSFDAPQLVLNPTVEIDTQLDLENHINKASLHMRQELFKQKTLDMEMEEVTMQPLYPHPKKEIIHSNIIRVEQLELIEAMEFTAIKGSEMIT